MSETTADLEALIRKAEKLRECARAASISTIESGRDPCTAARSAPSCSVVDDG